MKSIACLLSLISYISVASGQNLIPNPSFESINYCESRIPCSPAAWYSVSNVPTYGYQANLPKSIDRKYSLAFLVAFRKEIRSYWQTLLLCPLQSGWKYSVSFYLFAPKFEFDPGYFGVHFSDRMYRSTNDTILQIDESISIQKKHVRKLKNGWSEIKLSFIATGKERYLLLGNFAKISNKEILEISGKNSKYIEYYIDNITVAPVDMPETRCFDYQQRLDSLYAFNFRHTLTKKTEVVFNDTTNRPINIISDIDTIVLGKINFDFGSDLLLNPDSMEEYFRRVDLSMILKVHVIGFTDSVGSNSYNLSLSERRASSVRNFLLNTFKFPENMVLAEGRGISKDKHLLAENRRVEVIIYKKK